MGIFYRFHLVKNGYRLYKSTDSYCCLWHWHQHWGGHGHHILSSTLKFFNVMSKELSGQCMWSDLVEKGKKTKKKIVIRHTCRLW